MGAWETMSLTSFGASRHIAEMNAWVSLSDQIYM